MGRVGVGPPARAAFNQGLAPVMEEECQERRLSEGRGRGPPERKGRRIRKRPVLGACVEGKVKSGGKGLSEGLREGVC